MMRARLVRWGEWAALLALGLAALWILWGQLRPPLAAAAMQRRPVAITVTSLPGAGTAIGPFRLASAAEMTSPDKALGGLSGLAALPDGRLLAVTDAGDWLVWRPNPSTGLIRGEIGSIAMPGADKAERDAEAIALTPGGETLISLEQRHRILRFAGYGPPVTPAGDLYRTDNMGWPPNGGGEALAALGDGTLVWISEAARSAGGALMAVLVAPGGQSRVILIDPVDGFSPTDAAVLDDRRLLLLHRRYTGAQTAAAISVVDLGPVLAGGSAAPARILARWGRGGGWPVDNMEGLALVRREGRLPMLYVVSDDNFSAVQRTLLLQIEVTRPIS